jgi:alpha-glucosidase
LYRALLALRRAERALSIGDYAPLTAGEQVLGYERRFEGRRLAVYLNLTGEPARIEAPRCRVLLSTHARAVSEELSGAVRIGPNEGLVTEMV